MLTQQSQIKFQAGTVRVDDYVAFVQPAAPFAVTQSGCPGALIAMTEQVYRHSVDGIQLGADLTVTVTLSALGEHYVCIASTGGFSPISDADFRLTSATVSVVAASPSRPPLPPPPTPAAPPRLPPLQPLPPALPPSLPIVHRGVGLSEPTTSTLRMKDLVLVMGAAAIILIFLGLTAAMVRARLLIKPCIQMVPLTVGSLDMLTDVSFVMLCFDNQDVLDSKGLSMLPTLALAFLVLPCTVSTLSTCLILRRASKTHQLKQWLMMEVCACVE